MRPVRQPSLFRRRPKKRPPAAAEKPARLEIGDAGSVAYKRAVGAEKEKEWRDRSERQRRLLIGEASRRHWAEIRAGYPPPALVLAALAAELASGDYGLPPKRDRVERRVLARLRGSHPKTPLSFVQELFGHARRIGLLGRRGRLWVWLGPER